MQAEVLKSALEAAALAKHSSEAYSVIISFMKVCLYAAQHDIVLHLSSTMWL